MNSQRAKDEHLLAAWNENDLLQEQINRLKIALEVSGRDTDHYRAELHTANIRIHVLEQQNTRYRVEIEAKAKIFEDEAEALATRRSRAAAELRETIREAEMAPYKNGQLVPVRESMN